MQDHPAKAWNPLEQRCADISFRHKLTHVSSVLNAVNVIDAIYDRRQPGDPFVLGNSHAALALFVVLEKHGFCDAEEMVNEYGTHAARDPAHGVYVSGGSLGQAETVAVGMALADRSRTVNLVTSDGACAEGSVWEALRIADELDLHNLEIDVIANGWGAYGPIDLLKLHQRLHSFFLRTALHRRTDAKFPPWLQGLPGHYLTLTEEQWREFGSNMDRGPREDLRNQESDGR